MYDAVAFTKRTRQLLLLQVHDPDEIRDFNRSFFDFLRRKHIALLRLYA